VDAVLSVLAVALIWRLAVKGKGGAALRLVAWGSLIIVVWVLLAVENPGVADGIPGAFASGISQAVSGLGRFLGML